MRDAIAQRGVSYHALLALRWETPDGNRRTSGAFKEYQCNHRKISDDESLMTRRGDTKCGFLG